AFPALIVQTPRLRSASDNIATALAAPRSLYALMGCRFSRISRMSGKSGPSSRRIRGVRTIVCAIRLRASRISDSWIGRTGLSIIMLNVEAAVPAAILCDSNIIGAAQRVERFRYRRYFGCPSYGKSHEQMAKQTARKRKTALVAAANRRTAIPLSHTTTLKRPDLVILFGLAVITFGIYAQVIGHQFITLDDPTYIQENPMVNRGVTPSGLAWAFT